MPVVKTKVMRIAGRSMIRDQAFPLSRGRAGELVRRSH